MSGAPVTPLAGLTTGTIDYVLEMRLNLRGCFMSGQVRPVTPTTRFAGHARTLRALPTRADVVEAQRSGRLPNAHREALDQPQPGDVLVIDARGVTDAAVMGDVLCTRFKTAGGVAVVTDGCVRDLPGLVKLEFPIFAAGVHAATFGNRHVAIDLGLPVACGGVLVMPGDLIVGDEEGVVVVPAALESQVAELARLQDELDTFSIRKITSARRCNAPTPWMPGCAPSSTPSARTSTARMAENSSERNHAPCVRRLPGSILHVRQAGASRAPHHQDALGFGRLHEPRNVPGRRPSDVLGDLLIDHDAITAACTALMKKEFRRPRARARVASESAA